MTILLHCNALYVGCGATWTPGSVYRRAGHHGYSLLGSVNCKKTPPIPLSATSILGLAITVLTSRGNCKVVSELGGRAD